MVDSYVGYYEPYATSHDALDQDDKIMAETKNAARILIAAVTEMRSGRRVPGSDLKQPRPK